jgi:hypothetical protein
MAPKHLMVDPGLFLCLILNSQSCMYYAVNVLHNFREELHDSHILVK